MKNEFIQALSQLASIQQKLSECSRQVPAIGNLELITAQQAGAATDAANALRELHEKASPLTIDAITRVRQEALQGSRTFLWEGVNTRFDIAVWISEMQLLGYTITDAQKEGAIGNSYRISW